MSAAPPAHSPRGSAQAPATAFLRPLLPPAVQRSCGTQRGPSGHLGQDLPGCPRASVRHRSWEGPVPFLRPQRLPSLSSLPRLIPLPPRVRPAALSASCVRPSPLRPAHVRVQKCIRAHVHRGVHGGICSHGCDCESTSAHVIIYVYQPPPHPYTPPHTHPHTHCTPPTHTHTHTLGACIPTPARDAHPMTAELLHAVPTTGPGDRWRARLLPPASCLLPRPRWGLRSGSRQPRGQVTSLQSNLIFPFPRPRRCRSPPQRAARMRGDGTTRSSQPRPGEGPRPRSALRFPLPPSLAGTCRPPPTPGLPGTHRARSRGLISAWGSRHAPAPGDYKRRPRFPQEGRPPGGRIYPRV